VSLGRWSGDRPKKGRRIDSIVSRATQVLAGAARAAPPLSPVLLLGLALRPLPLAPLGPALAAAMWALRRRHPGLFERLGELGSSTFLIDPTDLPLMFRLHADPGAPRLEAVAESAAEPGAESVTAVIRGPLLALVDLVEGRIDGDTLFFRRDLVVEGDTEAVVALRNALESAEIVLTRELLAPLGPLSRPLTRLVEGGAAVMARLAEDVETVRGAAIWPAVRQGERTAGEVERLGQAVADLERRGRRRRAAAG
jgi:predicted lipid carrier protein YhbT